MNDRRILIVEDNPDDESLTQRGLRKAGAIVTVAHDGALALEALAAMEQLPDLVLLDLMLPDGDGLDFTRTLRGDARTPAAWWDACKENQAGFGLTGWSH